MTDGCGFCDFERGFVKQSIFEKCAGLNTGHMEYEIKPVDGGRYLYYVRHFDTMDNLVSESSIFIKYCPRCEKRLKGGMKGG